MPLLSEFAPLCRGALLPYCIAQWEGYQVAKHHQVIADHLERVERGEIKRLMINMPPRHGKTMLASEFFPAWYMSRNTRKQLIHVSYAQDMVDGIGRKVRNLLRSDAQRVVFPEFALADDSQAASRFHTADGGVYYAVGAGGPITGRGADLLLIDDPIKGREDADSETMRQKLKDWYASVAYTRLMPDAAVVIIQTRWHEDDLSGWILSEHRHEGWTVLSLPAIEEDRALWPEAYPLETLNEIRKTIGPREWEALYQQQPRAASGGEFKRHWMQYYRSASHDRMTKIMLVDPASAKRQNNDYTAMWVVGLGGDDNYYILDCIRDRLNLTERAEAVFRLHRKWKPAQVRYERYGMMADIEYLRSEMDRRSYRFRVVEVAGQTAKEDRIRRLVPLFERGQVWFPESIHYTDHSGSTRDLVEDFVEQELLAFPVGKHDDMLDGLSRINEPGLDLPWPAAEKVSVQYQFVPHDPVTGY